MSVRVRSTDDRPLSFLRRNILDNRPAWLPRAAKYDHCVYGVSREGNAIVHTDGRFFIPKKPIQVYVLHSRLGF